MIKNVGTAEEIRNEILRRIQESVDLGDSCRDGDIPVPRKVDPGENAGWNWVIDEFRGVAQECLAPLKAVIVEMMREYDLT
ncbi:hypothetical protein [Caballeronia zhejiangensis]|uniref:hypothetical protein n=1 Tax=Caballeronia zhejiangensis TaxID=871203 RepID=UPI001FD464A7|nr:hypothetical protein [Caballeronia zhejiangensis]